MYRILSTLLAALLLTLLSACPGSNKTTKADAKNPFDPSKANIPPAAELYPHWSERPFTDIHQDAKDAWFQVENAYLVIKNKYEQAQKLKESADPAEHAAGEQMYSEVVTEVNNVVFGTNPTVEALFKSAIEKEPQNPLNYATYAVYLKPRKRFNDGANFVNTEDEAIQNIDKAIELWPDEPSFVYMKIYTLTEPHMAHEWTRNTALEIDAIARRAGQVLDLYEQLEKLDPENAFVNYSHAMFLAKIYGPELGDEPLDEMVRELRKGNAKKWGKFYYPPPLHPFENDAMHPKLYATLQEPVYVDMWLHWGNLDPYAVNQVVRLLDSNRKWPQDKKDIGEVMYFLYALGRLEPFDRTFFNLQLKCLHKQQERLSEEKSPEAIKVAEATRFLAEQYMSVSNRMYKDGLIKDETRLGVLAIEDMENSPMSGKKYMYKYMQGPQASYLQRAGEILGLEFPLPADKAQW